MTANELVVYAHNLIGTPYVWGGSTPAQGLDCSGLLYWIQRTAGSDVGRYNAATYATMGERIPIGQQRPGDFLFFGSPVTHCAIYIGYGKMIESRGGRKNTADNPGTGVVISPVTRRHDLVCVRRVWRSSLSYVVGRTYRTQVDHFTCSLFRLGSDQRICTAVNGWNETCIFRWMLEKRNSSHGEGNKAG